MVWETLQANMALVKHQSVLDPALSHDLGHETLCTCLTPPRCLPPSKLVGSCELQETLLGEGCWVENARVVRSVLGCCTKVNASVVIEDCLVRARHSHTSCGLAYNEISVTRRG
jgi:ADP-glucose pyrophosphorylase